MLRNECGHLMIWPSNGHIAVCVAAVFDWTVVFVLPGDRCVDAGAREILQEVQKTDEELHGNHRGSHIGEERYISVQFSYRAQVST